MLIVNLCTDKHSLHCAPSILPPFPSLPFLINNTQQAEQNFLEEEEKQSKAAEGGGKKSNILQSTHTAGTVLNGGGVFPPSSKEGAKYGLGQERVSAMPPLSQNNVAFTVPCF